MTVIHTYFLIIPYVTIILYFYIYKRDNFFLKIRSSVQLLLMLILLAFAFINIVIWKAFFEDYTFLNFDIENKENNSKTTALVTALAATAAVFGWIFTSRVQIVNTIRSHSVQVLMNSRNSTVYMAKVDEATKIRRNLSKLKKESLSYEDFNKLKDEQKSSVTYLLNFLEFVAIGIRHNNLDEDLIRGSFKTILKSNFNLFEPIIKYLRTVDGDKIYNQLELLHKRWQSQDINQNKVCKCSGILGRIKKFLKTQPKWLIHITLSAFTCGVWIIVVSVMKFIESINMNKEIEYKCEKCSIK